MVAKYEERRKAWTAARKGQHYKQKERGQARMFVRIELYQIDQVMRISLNGYKEQITPNWARKKGRKLKGS